MKKLTFEQLFFKKRIKILTFNEFRFYLKFAYRADKNAIRIVLKNTGISIVSTGEYSYKIIKNK